MDVDAHDHVLLGPGLGEHLGLRHDLRGMVSGGGNGGSSSSDIAAISAKPDANAVAGKTTQRYADGVVETYSPEMKRAKLQEYGILVGLDALTQRYDSPASAAAIYYEPQDHGGGTFSSSTAQLPIAALGLPWSCCDVPSLRTAGREWSSWRGR